MFVGLFDKAIGSTQNVPQLEKVIIKYIFKLFWFINFEIKYTWHVHGVNFKFCDFFFQYILEDIFWSGTPLLESVGAHEPPVEKLRKQIKEAINQALIPMKAYAREYEKHLELMNLDINKYIA